MSKPETIAGQFREQDAKRASVLKRSRDYAALTIARVLPPVSTTQDYELASRWSDIGGEGAENMSGRLIDTIFPLGMPWFAVTITAEVRASRDITIEQKMALIAQTNERQNIAATSFEESNYRLVARSTIEDVLIAGNAMTTMRDDYDLGYYRFDNWVCRRSGTGMVLFSTVREKIHPIELTPEERQQAEIKADDDELHELYTRAKRVRVGGGWEWLVEQEVNEHIIRSRREPLSPHVIVTFALCPGDDYARGFVETRFGGIQSSNGLWQALNFGMANAAKMMPIIDASETNIRPSDLLAPNGEPKSGRVVGGVVQGIAFLQTNKASDFSMAFQGAKEIDSKLGRAMLMESAAMPKGERVTAFAVGRIAQELQGALGGFYAHIADQMQKPMLERRLWELTRDYKLEPITEDGQRLIKLSILTGASALARSMEFDKLLTVIQALAPIQGTLDGLKPDVLASKAMASRGIDTMGLFKTPQELADEKQAEAMQQIMPAAAAQAVKTSGALIESRAKAQQEQLTGSTQI